MPLHWTTMVRSCLLPHAVRPMTAHAHQAGLGQAPPSPFHTHAPHPAPGHSRVRRAERRRVHGRARAYLERRGRVHAPHQPQQLVVEPRRRRVVGAQQRRQQRQHAHQRRGPPHKGQQQEPGQDEQVVGAEVVGLRGRGGALSVAHPLRRGWHGLRPEESHPPATMERSVARCFWGRAWCSSPLCCFLRQAPAAPCFWVWPGEVHGRAARWTTPSLAYARWP